MDRSDRSDDGGADSDAFRDELRSWLAAHLTPEVAEAGAHPITRGTLDLLRNWNRTLADGGWAAPAWPVFQTPLGRTEGTDPCASPDPPGARPNSAPRMLSRNPPAGACGSGLVLASSSSIRALARLSASSCSRTVCTSG